jgi:uncharacterized protein YyaL (SSP411 family)
MQETQKPKPSNRLPNRLADESSPYLLQHAYNPVDWYPWGEAAFARAKAEDKPVLLSVGYSACHWCHVMEHESFENDEIAALMNENFVNIKVDREERPDIDQIYMNFVQMTTGRGGWPMTVFLTPEGFPFYGGTYFPPYDRYNMPGFPRLLLSIRDSYHEKRDEILHSAAEILGELRRMNSVHVEGGNLTKENLDSFYRSIIRGYDAKNGGFGGAPKFPAPMTLEFILRYYGLTKDAEALAIVTNTCRKMADGGMYDHLGGGFARYSVDAVWLVPHFEKMLYDNAQLAKLYTHVWQVTKDEYFKTKAEEILDYALREMTDELGGFYSAQDADSEGVEGKFFVWTPGELKEILGEENAKAFGFHYDVSESGNFEHGASILHERQSVEDSAAELNITAERLAQILAEGKQKLFEAREKRIKPQRDDKVLTAWNGLMLSAFAEAGFVLDRIDYAQAARKNADFILTSMQTPDGRLLRTYGNGKAKLNAYMEDYAIFADGLLDLFQTTGETRWLREAKRLADVMIEQFWDDEEGGFFFTGKDHEELIVRSKDYFDNATPSGNSVAAEVLLKLEKLTGEARYPRYASNVFRQLSGNMLKYPQAFGRALIALSYAVSNVKEIVIISDKGEEENELVKILRENYIPNKITVLSDQHGDTDLLPILEGKDLIGDSPTAFVCENYTCQEPTTEKEKFISQLGIGAL